MVFVACSLVGTSTWRHMAVGCWSGGAPTSPALPLCAGVVKHARPCAGMPSGSTCNATPPLPCSGYSIWMLRMVTSCEIKRRADFFAPFIMVRAGWVGRMPGAAWVWAVRQAAT